MAKRDRVDRHVYQGAAAAAFSYANTHHRPYNHQFSSMGSLPLYFSPPSNNSCSLGVQVPRQSMVEQRPSMLPSLVHGSLPRVPRFNNQEGVGGTFLLQGSGGGRSSTASNQEGDLKNIDLSLKL
ncbi:hypothetical protein MKW92_010098 [Papaver armeniacum]|nr:hypothetical protein MKW92_010098 [Papaver armeniacum]